MLESTVPWLAFKPFIYKKGALVLPTDTDTPLQKHTVLEAAPCGFCGNPTPPSDDCVCGIVSTLNIMEAVQFVVQTPDAVLCTMQVLGDTVLDDDGFRVRSARAMPNHTVFLPQFVFDSEARYKDYFSQTFGVRGNTLNSGGIDIGKAIWLAVRYLRIKRYDGNISEDDFQYIRGNLIEGRRQFMEFIRKRPCVNDVWLRDDEPIEDGDVEYDIYAKWVKPLTTTERTISL